MFRLLISAFLLIATLLISLSYSYEILLERGEKEITTKLDFEQGIRGANFKLSFSTNRPRFREDNGLLGWLFPQKSYKTSSMKRAGDFVCIDPASVDKTFVNSVEFGGEFKVNDIQVFASKDDSVSKWLRYNGILGISPMSLCDSTKQDPEAIINRMRGSNSGFIIDLPHLKFDSQFEGKPFRPLMGDGLTFQKWNWALLQSTIQ